MLCLERLAFLLLTAHQLWSRCVYLYLCFVMLYNSIDRLCEMDL
jgi:hypothetical protein